MSEEQNQPKTDTVPPRDDKGHFVSHTAHNPNPKKKRSKTKDDGTVKIKIIKDEESLPPTEFEGKLEDIKERTAIRFIHSVAARQPNKISIDGIIYVNAGYAAKRVKEVEAERDELGNKMLENCSVMKHAADVMDEQNELLENKIKDNVKLRRSCWFWRSIAIGTLMVLVSYFGCKCIDLYRASDNQQSIAQKVPAK